MEGLEEKVYFYYPAYGKITNPDGTVVYENYARRVLAGIVSEGKIHVGEAITFPGTKKRLPDNFNKKRGREIAAGRALKGKTVMVIDIPRGEEHLTGKLFVTSLAKVYPVKPASNKKKKKTTEETVSA